MSEKSSDLNPMDPTQMTSLKHWGETPDVEHVNAMLKDKFVQCGWGRLLFGQTYQDPEALVRELLNEREGQRDVALYMRDPNVMLSYAPQQLFLDPSLTFRLALRQYSHQTKPNATVQIRSAESAEDENGINRIYKNHSMVPLFPGFLASHAHDPHLITLVAIDSSTDKVIGAVTGVDHKAAINDPDNGSSLWALAVDAQCPLPGVGMMMVHSLASTFKERGRAFMDLSVMHNNEEAISLYTKLGFEQVPVYCIKTKNAINERLFVGPEREENLNIYAKIIVDEARRRGISVDIQDAENGFFTLSLGGQTVSCRESLSDLTSAVAMSRCDDKSVTRKILVEQGLNVPGQEIVDQAFDAQSFLERYSRAVVKPAHGEQGQGISVDLKTVPEIEEAIVRAGAVSDKVLVEEYVEGEDLRLIVIDGKMIAAAVRRPPCVLGDGQHTIQELIQKQSRRRKAATNGESEIPMDNETQRTVSDQGFGLSDVPDNGIEVSVRKTANLHTGGTIHDVTDHVHPTLARAAFVAAQILEMPVVGFDFLVPNVNGPDYTIIEANERPGLANHEPQPTAERFIDFLFPQTRRHGLGRGL